MKIENAPEVYHIHHHVSDDINEHDIHPYMQNHLGQGIEGYTKGQNRDE